MKTNQTMLKNMMFICAASAVLFSVTATLPTFAKDKTGAPPSQFDADKSTKFNEEKWRTLTNDGIAAMDAKKFDSAEQYFEAAVREASKSPSMSTFMIDSLVHTAEVYRQTNRKEEAKQYFDQALDLVSMLKADNCPLCKSNADSIPVIYGPHSEELESWAKAKAAELGDFKAVTQKRKKRPSWYCKTCEQAY